MNTKLTGGKRSAEHVVKDIRRATRRHFSSEDKIRIVLDGLRGEDSIAELCRKEGIAQSLYYTWSKEFLEAGKRRLAGDTARAVNGHRSFPECGRVKFPRLATGLGSVISRMSDRSVLSPVGGHAVSGRVVDW